MGITLLSLQRDFFAQDVIYFFEKSGRISWSFLFSLNKCEVVQDPYDGVFPVQDSPERALNGTEFSSFLNKTWSKRGSGRSHSQLCRKLENLANVGVESREFLIL